MGTYLYQATHNVLRAHAKAYRIYQSRYKNQYYGTCELFFHYPYGFY
jgi:hypothetical protein